MIEIGLMILTFMSMLISTSLIMLLYKHYFNKYFLEISKLSQEQNFLLNEMVLLKEQLLIYRNTSQTLNTTNSRNIQTTTLLPQNQPQTQKNSQQKYSIPPNFKVVARQEIPIENKKDTVMDFQIDKSVLTTHQQN